MTARITGGFQVVQAKPGLLERLWQSKQHNCNLCNDNCGRQLKTSYFLVLYFLFQYVYNVVLHVVEKISDFHFLFKFSFHLYVLFFLMFSFISQNSKSRKIKLNSKLLSFSATSISFCQTKSLHLSAFSDQIKHLRLLVPIQKYIFCLLYHPYKSVSSITSHTVYLYHRLFLVSNRPYHSSGSQSPVCYDKDRLGFVVEILALGHVFSHLIQLPLLSFIPPVLHIPP